jgi:hypothetical protein
MSQYYVTSCRELLHNELRSSGLFSIHVQVCHSELALLSADVNCETVADNEGSAVLMRISKCRASNWEQQWYKQLADLKSWQDHREDNVILILHVPSLWRENIDAKIFHTLSHICLTNHSILLQFSRYRGWLRARQFDSWQGRKVFPYFTASRSALMPTQPPGSFFLRAGTWSQSLTSI